MLDRSHELEGSRWVAMALGPDDAPALQEFLEANPFYSETFYGRPWPADAAAKELSDRPPAEWPQGETRHWAAVERGTGRWLGYIGFTEHLLAAGVWHLGFMVVDTSVQGSGFAREFHEAWANRAEREGARSLRLGVVIGNPRAEAFWTRLGYAEVKIRHDVPYGDLKQSISVRVKPVGGSTLAEHLERVARDRAETA